MEIRLAAVAVRELPISFQEVPCQDYAGCVKKNSVGVLALSDGAGQLFSLTGNS